ncbi:MAG: hypothetical protein ACQETG_09785 [Thermodesulfobacteriota bacterium]
MQYLIHGAITGRQLLYRLIFLLAAVCICSLPPAVSGAGADNVRKPAVAGTFYPAEPEELKKNIAELTAQAEKTCPTLLQTDR